MINWNEVTQKQIHSLEQQTEILKKQTSFNFVLAIATAVLALATICNVVLPLILSQEKTISFDTKTIIILIVIAFFAFLAGILSKFLFEMLGFVKKKELEAKARKREIRIKRKL